MGGSTATDEAMVASENIVKDSAFVGDVEAPRKVPLTMLTQVRDFPSLAWTRDRVHSSCHHVFYHWIFLNLPHIFQVEAQWKELG